jgi:hypothetical protein
MSNVTTGGENGNLDFRSWMSGFIDGEGCLYIVRNNSGAYVCGMTVELRSDDADILRRMQNELGIGRVYVRQSPSRSFEAAYWMVTKKADALTLCEFFDTFPLQAKKRRDMVLWQRAVRLHQTVKRNADNTDILNGIQACKRDLEEGRRRPS